MPGKSKRLKLVLTPQEVQHLQRLRASRTAPVREVQRAEILWRYHSGETIAEIMRAVKMTRKSVGKWINRALAIGVEAALKDAYHRPRPPGITADAKAWVVHLACSKPTQLGYAAELWTRSALALHVRRHAVEAGYPALAQAAKATVHRILAEQPLHPEKVKYYLERRDPDFESKMRQVLLVYREVAFQNEPSRRPIAGRDHGFGRRKARRASDRQRRAGPAAEAWAASLCGSRLRVQTAGNVLDSGGAGLALRPGNGAGRHRSREFILLLKDLDQFSMHDPIETITPPTYRRRRKPTWRRVRTASNTCTRRPTGPGSRRCLARWRARS